VTTRSAAPRTVDEYIARQPRPARRMLTAMRRAIRSAAPRGAIETISYRIPAIRQRRILVWFGAFADHCSLFPTAAAIAACKADLEGYTVSKGTVQFPYDKPLPVALIKRLVRVRVAQSFTPS
jgi:uncharacterized protein YdhG (YjbR/CyaY superfamily)